MTPSRKQAQSEGGGFPQWLAELGVRPGGFYIETKARLVHAMKNKAWQDEPRVWACLALHTMAFQQELAVRMEGGALVPLRQVDIARETGIDVRKVQRAVQNLEKQGSVARQGQVKGEVKIICYAVPRPPKKEADVETTSAPASIYDGLPDDLAVWLRKFKFGAPETEKLNEAVQEAREVELHVQRLRELCKRGHSANRATVAILPEPRSRATKMDPARGVENSKMDPARQPKSTPRADAHIRKKELKEITAAAVESPTDYRKAAAAVRQKFPQADNTLVARLAESCKAMLNGESSDEVLASAVAAAYVPTQKSAGLFLRTVPEVLKHWTENRDPRISPHKPQVYALASPGPTRTERLEAEKQENLRVAAIMKEILANER